MELTFREKIRIFKFNLKNKCMFGNKCKFHYLKVNEINEILNELEDLKRENKLLKSNLQGKAVKSSNLSNENCDVTEDCVCIRNTSL